MKGIISMININYILYNFNTLITVLGSIVGVLDIIIFILNLFINEDEKRKNNKIIIAILFITFLIVMVLTIYTNNLTKVPNVVNLTYEDAKTLLIKNDLRFNTYLDKNQEVVASQSYEAGEIVQKNTIIVLELYEKNEANRRDEEEQIIENITSEEEKEQTTEDVTSEEEDKVELENENTSTMFTNVILDYDTTSSASGVTFSSWDTDNDLDIRGTTHNDGYKIEMFNYFPVPNVPNGYQISANIIFAYNNSFIGEKKMNGHILLCNESAGTKSVAQVIIYVDGEEKWRTEELITGNTVAPVEFSINIDDIESDVNIQVNSDIEGSGINLGIFLE